ncbi:hypothetical protein D3C76_928930 [compost metagenome]
MFVIGWLKAIVVGSAGQQGEGALEAAGLGRQFGGQAQVPFAAHQGLVTGIAKQLRQGHHAVIEIAFVAWLADQFRGQRFGHGTDAGDVVVGAGEQHRAGWRAGRRGVEVGQAQAGVGQGVEVRGADLAAEGADVGEAEVVGDDHQEVRAAEQGIGHGAVPCGQ